MTTWYQITPFDTLFFRGAEPMEAGQPSRDALFPPPVSVIQGALRTALLKQHGVAFADYKTDRCPPELRERIGACGQPAPFHITAFLLSHRGTLYAPAPANWFADAGLSPSEPEQQTDLVGRPILRAVPPEGAGTSLRLHSSAGTGLPMVRAVDARSLAGYWLRLDCLHTPPDHLAAGDLLAPGELYDVEPRTGIGLTNKRTVRQGAIYTAAHIRLRRDVHMMIGIDRDLGLKEQGVLTLGGERRMCSYTRGRQPNLPSGAARLFLTLAPVELTEELLPAVFAAAKPVALAGWDLAIGFHKPTTTWLPAGAVLTHNSTPSCIPLA